MFYRILHDYWLNELATFLFVRLIRKKQGLDAIVSQNLAICQNFQIYSILKISLSRPEFDTLKHFKCNSCNLDRSCGFFNINDPAEDISSVKIVLVSIQNIAYCFQLAFLEYSCCNPTARLF